MPIAIWRIILQALLNDIMTVLIYLERMGLIMVLSIDSRVPVG